MPAASPVTVRRWFTDRPPAQLIALGYASYALVTCALLQLPVMWEDGPVSLVDSLFVATSGMSTTGLITVNTPIAWTFPGELVVLLSFQLGGIGYMTAGSVLLLARHRDLPEHREGAARATFTLPAGFTLPAFLRNVVVFTVAVEAAGAAGLWWAFGNAGVEAPLWPAIFHAVSAFCTAGFSVFPDSLEQFTDDVWVNAIVTVLSYLGAIGFIVVTDVVRRVRTGEPTSFTTKVILTVTVVATAAGWALMWISDPAMRALPLPEALQATGFQSMTAMTTVGFNTYPIGDLAPAALMLALALMVLGASPSGTGGGLKSTTVSAIWATLISTVRGEREVHVMGRVIPDHRLQQAQAAAALYIVLLVSGSFVLLLTEAAPFADVVFEATSALGTVGLSRGITPDLTTVGKLVVTGLMYAGRVGPVSLGLALVGRLTDDAAEHAHEDLAV